MSRREGAPLLFVLNLTGREVKRLPVGGKVVATWRPAVSPDGRMIAFKGKEASDPVWWIYVMDFPSGERLRRLGVGSDPCWFPVSSIGLYPLSKMLTLWSMLKIRFRIPKERR